MSPGYHRHYRIIDTDFHIGISSRKFAHTLDHLLSGFRTSDTSRNALRYTISQASDHSLILHTPDGESCQYPDSDSALTEIEIAMIHRAIAQMPYVGLHAGAVCWRERAVLIAGTSGRGKTTLSLGCALMGARFLSDEIAVINPQSGKVCAFPRTLCVKNQSLSLFDPVDPDGRLVEPEAIQTIANTQCVRADMLTIGPLDTWYSVHAIVCPTYSPDTRTKRSKATQTETVSRLLSVAMNRNRLPQQSFDTVAKLATSIPCYTLHMGDLSDAVSQIKTLCTETL